MLAFATDLIARLPVAQCKHEMSQRYWWKRPAGPQYRSVDASDGLFSFNSPLFFILFGFILKSARDPTAASCARDGLQHVPVSDMRNALDGPTILGHKNDVLSSACGRTLNKRQPNQRTTAPVQCTDANICKIHVKSAQANSQHPMFT